MSRPTAVEGSTPGYRPITTLKPPPIGQQSIAVLQGLPLTEQQRSAVAVAEWTMFTLAWVTITLPCFGSLCVVIGLQQVRDYRKHNAAVATLEAAERRATDLLVQSVVFERQLEAAQATLQEVATVDLSTPGVRERGAAAYLHGALAGGAERQRQSASAGARDRAALIVMDRLRKAQGSV